jgi:hypothetical protein
LGRSIALPTPNSVTAPVIHMPTTNGNLVEIKVFIQSTNPLARYNKKRTNQQHPWQDGSEIAPITHHA